MRGNRNYMTSVVRQNMYKAGFQTNITKKDYGEERKRNLSMQQ